MTLNLGESGTIERLRRRSDRAFDLDRESVAAFGCGGDETAELAFDQSRILEVIEPNVHACDREIGYDVDRTAPGDLADVHGEIRTLSTPTIDAVDEPGKRGDRIASRREVAPDVRGSTTNDDRRRRGDTGSHLR
jgi:hypothetical protein